LLLAGQVVEVVLMVEVVVQVVLELELRYL
jgi:hypothetical protein